MWGKHNENRLIKGGFFDKINPVKCLRGTGNEKFDFSDIIGYNRIYLDIFNKM